MNTRRIRAMNKNSNSNTVSRFVMYIVIFFSGLFFIYFLQGEDAEYVKWIGTFSNFADFIASIVLTIVIVVSTIIVVANHWVRFNRLTTKVIKDLITLIPNDVYIGKKIKSFLRDIIKENKKIIIILPNPNETNNEIVFLLLLGFLEQLKVELSKDGIDLVLPNGNIYPVEIIFVKPISDDIADYFSERLEENYEYIIITGMSEVYRNAIYARDGLEDVNKREQLKIIGSLSSISVESNDQSIYDDNIIRVFPPDYDEAEAAIDFLMSRIRNNICHIDNCSYSKKKSNIVVLHANEYGCAVKNKCEDFFKEHMKNIYRTTNANLCPVDLEDCIGFYSFTYKDSTLTYDTIRENTFDKYSKIWEETESSNYFFFVGYEPNVSSMLNIVKDKIPNLSDNFVFLFSTPMSLHKWRIDINTILDKFDILENENYYLSVNTENSSCNILSIDENKDNYTSCTVQKISKTNELIPITLGEMFEDYFSEEGNNTFQTYREDNYISKFAKLSIDIAKDYIRTEKSLLHSKQIIYKKEGINLKLLMNGDSINNFKIFFINQEI